MNKSEAGKLGYKKSQITQQKQKQQRIDDYNKNPNLCLYCGKPIVYDKRHNKFCNSSCAATYNNLHKKPKDYGKCLHCGKPLNRSGKKYCNNKCQAQYKKQQVLEQWKNGLHNGHMPNGQISVFIKNYLLEKHNYTCEKCGWGQINPYTNKVPLEIHHIDGNWENNNEDNLQVLCPNCHSLTDTYKASNKGNGRIIRRK